MLACALFVLLEQFLRPLEVGRDVDLIVIFEENTIVRIEMRQFVVLRRCPVKGTEKSLEDIRHQVPRWPHIEPKAIALESTRPATELLVFLDDVDVSAGISEITRTREAPDTTSNNDNGLIGQRLHRYS